MLNDNDNYKTFGVTTYVDFFNRLDLYQKRVNDDPTKDLNGDLPLLRGLSKFLFETDTLKSFVKNAVASIIGKGLSISPNPSIADPELKRRVISEIVSHFEEFSLRSHIDGQQDLSSIERAIVSSYMRDGDVLAKMCLDDDGEFKLDLIAADRIKTPSDDIIKKSRLKGVCILGVQVSPKGKILGYWVANDFAKDGFTFMPTFDKQGRFYSVLLSDPYNCDRLKSYRGLPIASHVLNKCSELLKLKTAEVQASIMKTKTYATINTSQVNDLANDLTGGTTPDVTDSLDVKRLLGVDTLILPKGTEHKLTSGKDISNPDIEKINKIFLVDIASAFNIPYNILLNCLEDSSYSTNQTMKMAAWEAGEIHRDYIAKNLLTPMYRLLLEYWIETGKIKSLRNYSLDVAKVDWIGKANFQLKSKDLFEAQALAVKTGQKSLIDVCAENGKNAYTILDERLDYIATLKRKLQEKGLSAEDLLLEDMTTKEVISPKETK